MGTKVQLRRGGHGLEGWEETLDGGDSASGLGEVSLGLSDVDDSEAVVSAGGGGGGARAMDCLSFGGRGEFAHADANNCLSRIWRSFSIVSSSFSTSLRRTRSTLLSVQCFKLREGGTMDQCSLLQ